MRAGINKLLKPLGVGLADLDERPYWPRGRVASMEQRFLFLLTPPNAGSSEIAAYLSARGDIGGVHPSFEGQRLVKGLMDSDRWWPEKFVDFEAVVGAWSRAIAAGENRRYWLEKSPPNLVRHEQLLRHFPQHRAVVSNREPLANIASQLRRYLFKEYHGARRALVVRHLAGIWLWRSRRLMEAVQNFGYPCVTYEMFCARPAAIAEAFGLDGSDADERADMNEEHARFLSDQEREMVEQELCGEAEVLEFFGYDLKTES